MSPLTQIPSQPHLLYDMTGAPINIGSNSKVNEKCFEFVWGIFTQSME